LDASSPEFVDENQVEYGYLKKVKFASDKKNWGLEIFTKDQRVFKFRFDTQNLYEKYLNAVDRFARIQ